MASMLHNTVLAAAIAGVGACGDSTGVDNVVGRYEATEFTLSGSVSGDVLAEGGSLAISLETGGECAGQLSIPATIPGGPLVADLVGTYVVRADTVWLNQAADTFVRDVPWIIGPNRLTGNETFSGTTVSVVLERVGD